MSDTNSVRIRTEEVRERTATFLRRVHRVDPTYRTARDTGISESTIKNWLAGNNSVAGYHLAILALTYGPDYLDAIYGDAAPAWLSPMKVAAALDEVDQTIETAKAERARILSEFSDAGGRR